MKKVLSLLITAVIAASLFTACSTKSPVKKGKNYHTLYFKDKSKCSKASATFFNSKNNKKETVEMEKISEDSGSTTYSCDGNISKYNMAYITYDGINSLKFAFNKCVSGWYNSDIGFLPYVQGEKTTYKYKYKTVNFKFSGYNKLVHIWTPDGYKNSGEKYSTIYLLDGHAADFIEQPVGHTVAESDNATEQVKAMMSNTGKKVILVAIETEGDNTAATRDDELIPNLGKMAHEEGTSKKLGTKLADFIANTLKPYIKKHYNVYSDSVHTSITGTSLSALEAFYVTMKYPGKFGSAGVLSPSFWTYGDKAWRKFLRENKFGKDSPFLYIYSGGKRGDTGAEATEMVNRLKDMGYPKDKLAYHFNERGTHDVTCWRSVFAEYLEAAAFGHVDVIQ